MLLHEAEKSEATMHSDAGDSFCAGTLLTSRNDVIKAHMSESPINSIIGYAPAVLLFNRPSYSGAMSAINDGFNVCA